MSRQNKDDFQESATSLYDTRMVEIHPHTLVKIHRMHITKNEPYCKLGVVTMYQCKFKHWNYLHALQNNNDNNHLGFGLFLCPFPDTTWKYNSMMILKKKRKKVISLMACKKMFLPQDWPEARLQFMTGVHCLHVDGARVPVGRQTSLGSNTHIRTHTV